MLNVLYVVYWSLGVQFRFLLEVIKVRQKGPKWGKVGTKGVQKTISLKITPKHREVEIRYNSQPFLDSCVK